MSPYYKYLVIFVVVLGIIIIPIIAVTIHSRNARSKNNLKLVIDHDGGADDSMAIFMALLYEKYFDGPSVIGLTTNHGNVYEDQVFINSQRILDIAKRRDVPIYRGSNTSLVQSPKSDIFYGVDGLGDTNYHSVYRPIEAQPKHAVEALIELSKQHKGKLIVVAIGPLTNIALAMKIDPNFVGRLKHLYLAGGHIHDAKNPDPEFNALMDVEAYHIAAGSSTLDAVTFIPFSQTMSSANLTREWRENVLGVINTTIMHALNAFENSTIVQNERWHPLDPTAMGAVLNNTVINETKYSNNSIILCGDQRGINTNNLTDKEYANVRLVYSINKDAFKQLLMNIFSADTS